MSKQVKNSKDETISTEPLFLRSAQDIDAIGGIMDSVLSKVAKDLIQGTYRVAYFPEERILSVFCDLLDFEKIDQLRFDIELTKEDDTQKVSLRAYVHSSLVNRLGSVFAGNLMKEARYFTRDRSEIEETGIGILPNGGDVSYSYEFHVCEFWVAITDIDTPRISDAIEEAALAKAVFQRFKLMDLFWHICFHQHLRDSTPIENHHVYIEQENGVSASDELRIAKIQEICRKARGSATVH